MATNFRLKFSSNLSTMFTNVPLEQRFNLAAQCGFDTVEISDPYVLLPDILAANKGDLKVDLINLHAGKNIYKSNFFSNFPQITKYFVTK